MITKLKQFGMPRSIEDIKAIIIHNTSNYEMNARQLYDFMENKRVTSEACHFLVDENEVVEVMPLDYVAWNSGMGYDFANMNGIAIEICSNCDRGKYLQAEQRAVDLIKSLMEEYHLTKDDIFFHNTFCEYINCPANILQIYGNLENFKKKYFND